MRLPVFGVSQCFLNQRLHNWLIVLFSASLNSEQLWFNSGIYDVLQELTAKYPTDFLSVKWLIVG